eukprot:TRINITY_DN21628_c0_g1_i1.p1 TRINITY_DN21628_c0_g1~~TRINITY_DN21628_c0_g1_i1.p1  ORF type:complete len:119 (+),score=5.77 TRINITY_DN21628_c0_g1_i1:239-595(+)
MEVRFRQADPMAGNLGWIQLDFLGENQRPDTICLCKEGICVKARGSSRWLTWLFDNLVCPLTIKKITFLYSNKMTHIQSNSVQHLITTIFAPMKFSLAENNGKNRRRKLCVLNAVQTF